MAIIVNGKRRPLPAPPTLDVLLGALTPNSPFAVAFNGEFVAAANYDLCLLSDGDSIEIVHPSAGG
jgi:sulfur carrier protein